MKLSVRRGLLAATATVGLILAAAAPQATAAGPQHPASTTSTEQAGGQRVAPGDPVRDGSPDSAVDRVADFYGAYIDAVSDGTDNLSDGLRAHYLTADFQQRLAAWEQANHADGVLRAQDVPTHWEVRYHDSGAGHLFTTVTLTWGTGPNATHTKLAVQSDLSTKLISDIEDAPAGY
ncbi:hypothetical protein ACFV84_36695 [Kitasatospora sp. NPDC059811]|uniref:hypothetical protein n=1 Tax=Streptomycetaceae TaxID=2062 RepID=UPI0007AF862D|nr:hypothetical protein [Streptomyces sp. MJM8645]